MITAADMSICIEDKDCLYVSQLKTKQEFRLSVASHCSSCSLTMLHNSGWLHFFLAEQHILKPVSDFALISAAHFHLIARMCVKLTTAFSNRMAVCAFISLIYWEIRKTVKK